ncbi:hypothetical protein DD829_00165 [Chryseobacterium sp. HMWF035]|nr:hypothetical protein DBR25_17075 [Chryseobacterium sp. HMWF001]PVV62116.1 hypothetical protein DD829_00165 [Chryseobacterium sp. HMWF035]
MKHKNIDLRKWSVKKNNFMNVKKIPLFECDGNIKSKNKYSIRASFGDFRVQFKFLAGVSSLEFLFLLFQDKRKHKRNIFSYVILKETKWIEESLNLDRFLLRRNDKIN